MAENLPDPTLFSLLAALATANAEASAAQDRQKEVTDRVAKYLSICASPPGASNNSLPHWPVDAGHVDLMRPSKVARREGCSADTIVRRCRDHGVGKKYGRYWWVSLARNELWKKKNH